MISNNVFTEKLSAPVRSIEGKVEIYEGSTLALACGCHDRLKSFTVERVGEQGKFFGFGICQKLNVHLLDTDRTLNISTANNLKVEFEAEGTTVKPCPNFYVTEVNRDENTNELSITAYDLLHNASAHKVAELGLPESYTIKQVASACASFLGVTMGAAEDEAFNREYAQGANFDGTETLREALNAVAEATQTIYFINHNLELVFVKLDKDAAPALIIGKDQYFTLDSKTNRRLASIVSATELGDNVEVSMAVSGTAQYVRDNPFWELREDISTLVQEALDNIGGLTINQFSCSWRGNFLLEIGDKIELIGKDNKGIIAYVLDDVFTYNGSLSGITQWHYEENNEETATNPASLGDALKQTYAKVDKANKRIEIVASEQNEKIAKLEVDTEGISATVTQNETDVNNKLTDIEDSVSTLSTSFEQTANDFRLSISKLENTTVDSVTTSTGFTFNEKGLTVSESESAISTTITNDGMTVYSESDEVLIANSSGVVARNLHAKPYLIIGENSRFEDYQGNRTACFWIGG